MDLQRIRDLREDMDKSQKQIAEILHISTRSYSGYETGYRQIPIDIIIQLANFHNTSTDYLLGRTDVKEPYPKSKRKYL